MTILSDAFMTDGVILVIVGLLMAFRAKKIDWKCFGGFLVVCGLLYFFAGYVDKQEKQRVFTTSLGLQPQPISELIGCGSRFIKII